jgi:hypothetical protein
VWGVLLDSSRNGATPERVEGVLKINRLDYEVIIVEISSVQPIQSPQHVLLGYGAGVGDGFGSSAHANAVLEGQQDIPDVSADNRRNYPA